MEDCLVTKEPEPTWLDTRLGTVVTVVTCALVGAALVLIAWQQVEAKEHQLTPTHSITQPVVVDGTR